LGNRWYANFLARSKDKLTRGRGRVRDVKRHTWCYVDAFQNMYDIAYETMYEAGVAEKLLEPTFFFNIHGKITSNPTSTFGRASKY
jgi:hypothetical protein